MQKKNAPRERRPGNRRRPDRRGALRPVLTFVVIVAAVVLAMSVFFKVTTIEVTGNSAYTPEEIIKASGIEKGDNLFFVNRISAGSRIIAKLPYIEKASIARGLPNRVTINVTESQALAYIALGEDMWTVDRNCKVLAKTTGDKAAALIRVDGIELFSPSVGEIATTTAEDAAKVTYLADILSQIQERKLQENITSINMATITNPSFDYLGKYTVKLGSDENTEYKFGLLEAAVTQLGDGYTGTFDLSIDKQAHFSPN